MADLATQTHINLDWLWQNMVFKYDVPIIPGRVRMTRDVGPFRVLDCLYFYAYEDKEKAYRILFLGAGHDLGTQKNLEKYYNTYGEIAFWDLVIRAAKNFKPQDVTPGSFQTNIKWQRIHNWGSLKAAKSEFEKEAPNPYAGMYELMLGQKHNVGVMKQYRYFYRSHQNLLLDMVHQYGQDDAPLPRI